MTKEIKDLKIIFLGTPTIAATILDGLIRAGYPIHTVITQPDRAQGRSKELVASPVKSRAKEAGLNVFQPDTKQDLEEYVVGEKPDLIIVCAFGMILTEKTLHAARLGAINVHPSLLPRYRGPSPIAAPIAAGDKVTGTTIMMMSAGMDEGDILTQADLPLTGTETTETLTETLAALSAKLLIDTLPRFLAGEVRPVKQDDSLATYTKLAKKEDGKIDWTNETAAEIERKSRAFYPWPGVYTTYQNKKLDLYGLSVSDRKLAPGAIGIENGAFEIGAKQGAVKIAEVKLEAKNRVPAADFIRGYPDLKKTKLA